MDVYFTRDYSDSSGDKKQVVSKEDMARCSAVGCAVSVKAATRFIDNYMLVGGAGVALRAELANVAATSTSKSRGRGGGGADLMTTGGDETLEASGVFAKHLHDVWVPWLRQVVKDLRTWGFSVVRFMPQSKTTARNKTRPADGYRERHYRVPVRPDPSSYNVEMWKLKQSDQIVYRVSPTTSAGRTDQRSSYIRDAAVFVLTDNAPRVEDGTLCSTMASLVQQYSILVTARTNAADADTVLTHPAMAEETADVRQAGLANAMAAVDASSDAVGAGATGMAPVAGPFPRLDPSIVVAELQYSRQIRAEINNARNESVKAAQQAAAESHHLVTKMTQKTHVSSHEKHQFMLRGERAQHAYERGIYQVAPGNRIVALPQPQARSDLDVLEDRFARAAAEAVGVPVRLVLGDATRVKDDSHETRRMQMVQVKKWVNFVEKAAMAAYRVIYEPDDIRRQQSRVLDAVVDAVSKLSDTEVERLLDDPIERSALFRSAEDVAAAALPTVRMIVSIDNTVDHDLVMQYGRLGIISGKSGVAMMFGDTIPASYAAPDAAEQLEARWEEQRMAATEAREKESADTTRLQQGDTEAESKLKEEEDE